MRRLVRCALVSSLACCLATTSSEALAQEEDEAAEARVVQERKFVLGHEFFAMLGWLPMDAFEKGIATTGGYALHFSEEIAVEIGFTKSFTYQTSLRQDLLDLGVEPTPFEVLDYFVSGVFEWSPLYGKLAVGSGGLVHIDVTFSAGGGYGWFDVETRPLALLGVGMRLYLSSVLSARLDVRSLHFIKTEADAIFSAWDLHNELSIALGLALSVGG